MTTYKYNSIYNDPNKQKEDFIRFYDEFRKIVAEEIKRELRRASFKSSYYGAKAYLEEHRYLNDMDTAITCNADKLTITLTSLDFNMRTYMFVPTPHVLCFELETTYLTLNTNREKEAAQNKFKFIPKSSKPVQQNEEFDQFIKGFIELLQNRADYHRWKDENEKVKFFNKLVTIQDDLTIILEPYLEFSSEKLRTFYKEYSLQAYTKKFVDETKESLTKMLEHFEKEFSNLETVAGSIRPITKEQDAKLKEKTAERDACKAICTTLNAAVDKLVKGWTVSLKPYQVESRITEFRKTYLEQANKANELLGNKWWVEVANVFKKAWYRLCAGCCGDNQKYDEFSLELSKKQKFIKEFSLFNSKVDKLDSPDQEGVRNTPPMK